MKPIGIMGHILMKFQDSCNDDHMMMEHGETETQGTLDVETSVP